MRIIKSIALGLGFAMAATRLGSERPRLVVLENPRKTKGAPEPQRAAPALRKPKAAEKPNWSTFARQAVSQFFDDDCLSMGASLAYCATFSLAPLLLIVISLAGLFLGQSLVTERLVEQISGLVGAEAARQISTMLENASRRSQGMIGAVVGFFAVMVGATGAFAQLQVALNRAWQIEFKSKSGAITTFLKKRLLSLGMILGIGFLLLVSLVLSTATAGLTDWLGNMLPEWFSTGFGLTLEFVVSLAMTTVLFAAIFRVLPDIEIHWCDVWVGAGLTALLFTVGKFLIGLYLAHSSFSSSYGAAGSLVVILVWTYYSSLIILLGAEFTQVWVERQGQVSICRKDHTKIG